MNGSGRENAAFCRKKALPTARALLSRDGNRTTLILSILICAVASFLPTLVISWPLTYLLDWEGMYYDTPLLYTVLYYLEWLIGFVFFFLTATPLYLGIYRMAVQMSREEAVHLLDVFYYFGSKRLYRRALLILLRTACFLLPVCGAIQALADAVGIENGMLVVVLSLLLLVAVFFICLVIFSCTGGYITLSILRENAPLSECAALARELSRGRMWGNVLFLLPLVWRLLLSLLSVGVVLLLHTLPVSLLASANYVGRLAEGVIDLNS